MAPEDSETKATEFAKAEPEYKEEVTYIMPSKLEAEAIRRKEWINALQAGLQEQVQKAADIRKKIVEAKTKTKKEYYQKKFNKVQPKVMEMVAMLQRLQAQDKAPPKKEEKHAEEQVPNASV